jgi:hypothetical protein
LDLPLPVTGTESGVWGDITNNGLTEYLDIAIAGSLSLSSDADVNLATTEGNASGTNVTSTTAQYMILNCSGSRTVTRNINAPKQSKLYVVINATTGGQSVVLRGGPTTPTTGVTIANGTTVLCAWNGSDFVSVGVATSLATPLAVVGNATAGAEIRLPEDTDNGSNYVALKAPDTLASNLTFTLPSVDGSSGQVLQTNGSGTLSFGTYVAPATATTFTATQTFSGSSSAIAAVLTNTAEVCTVSATAATGTINYDVTTQSVLYYTSNASANWTVNFRGSSGTSLNTLMSTGQSLTVAFLVTQGSTAYYNSAVQVDGASVTPKWQGGTAPTSGNASSIDIYAYTIVKTGSATFTVFASQTKFA